jgi:hypothetical protein
MNQFAERIQSIVPVEAVAPTLPPESQPNSHSTPSSFDDRSPTAGDTDLPILMLQFGMRNAPSIDEVP